MKIIVCMKEIPLENNLPYTSHGTLIRKEEWQIGEEDKAALEAALRLKDEDPFVEISILTMGPSHAKAMLYEGLGKGADNAYLISDPSFAMSDSITTSNIIGRAIKKIGYDMIFCGCKSEDAGTGNVPGQLGGLLNIPILPNLISYSIYNEKVIFSSQWDEGIYKGESSLPCLLSFHKNSYVPRLPNMALLAKSYNEGRIIQYNRKSLGFTQDEVGWKGSLIHIKEQFIYDRKNKGYIFDQEPDIAVRNFIQKLKKDQIL